MKNVFMSFIFLTYPLNSMEQFSKNTDDTSLHEAFIKAKQKMRINRKKEEQANRFNDKVLFFITKIKKTIALFNEIKLNHDNPENFRDTVSQSRDNLLRISNHLRTFLIALYTSVDPNKYINYHDTYNTIDIYWNGYDMAFDAYKDYCDNYRNKKIVD